MITTIVNKSIVTGGYTFSVKHSVYGIPIQKVQSKEILGNWNKENKTWDIKRAVTTAWLQENGKEAC